MINELTNLILWDVIQQTILCALSVLDKVGREMHYLSLVGSVVK